MTCSCPTAVTKRIGEIISSRGTVLGRFHLDCPVHGIKVLSGEDRSEPLTVVTHLPKVQKKRRKAA